MAQQNKHKTKSIPEKHSAFQKAVAQTSDVAQGYRKGLQALRRNETSLSVAANPQKLDGSLDIDSTVKHLYPESSRWDYAVCYDLKVCFVEVHPAYTSEVQTMKQKLSWLKAWLTEKAPAINALPTHSQKYVWVQSGKSAILPNSRQAKELASIGLKPVPVCKLG